MTLWAAFEVLDNAEKLSVMAEPEIAARIAAAKLPRMQVSSVEDDEGATTSKTRVTSVVSTNYGKWRVVSVWREGRWLIHDMTAVR